MNDILTNEKYAGNTDYINTVLFRYFFDIFKSVRFIGITFNNEIDILNKEQKINNIKYFLISFFMTSYLQEHPDDKNLVLMSLSNTDYFKIDQSNFANPLFKYKNNQGEFLIPKEKITFIFMTDRAIRNISHNVRVLPLRYAIPFRNKPVQFVSDINLRTIQAIKNETEKKMKDISEKNIKTVQTFKKNNQIAADRLINDIDSKLHKEMKIQKKSQTNIMN